MPYPQDYAREFGFASFQETHPQSPLPGDQVDVELDAVGKSTDALIAFLKKFTRSDGRLANGSVGVDQLAADLSIGFKAPTTWESGVQYAVSDTVFYLSGFYNCDKAHTSGASFDPENWTLIFDLGYGAMLGTVMAAAGFFNSPVVSVITELPTSPTEGARYLVANSGTVSPLVGKENQVVQYANGAWGYSGTPPDGQQTYVQSVQRRYKYNSANSQWKQLASKLVQLSDFATLALADAFAAATGLRLVIDEDVTLTTNTTLAAPQVAVNGGVIAGGSYTLTISGAFSAGHVQAFSGTGLVTFSKLRGPLLVDWFCTPGAADDTAGVLAATASFNASAANGGVFQFEPRLYTVRSDTAGNLCVFSNLTGISVLGCGAKIIIPLDKAVGPAEGVFFIFSGCVDVFIDGFRTDGPTFDTTLPSNPLPGYEFIRLGQGCRNVHLGANKIKNMIAGLSVAKGADDPDSYRSQNIIVDLLDCTNCGYGIDCQYSGDFMTVHQLRTDNIHRSFFIYSVSNVKARVWSKDHKAYDVIIGSTITSTLTENIEIEYYSDEGATDCAQSKVVILAQGTTAQTFRNINIKLDVRFAGSGSTGGAALLFRKQKNDGSSDDTGRGHVFENIKISGVVIGQGSETGAGVTVGSTTMCTDINCSAWEGETFKQIVFEDLTVKPTAATGNPKFYFGGATEAIVLRNVVSTRDFIIRHSETDARLPYTAKVSLHDVKCLNLSAVSADSSQPLDRVRSALLSDTVQTGWSGKIVGNAGYNADMTWNLPPAIAAQGLKYVFARDYSALIHVQPDGTDTIRAGTSGGSAAMSSAGNLLALECFVDGFWETAYKQGSVTYN